MQPRVRAATLWNVQPWCGKESRGRVQAGEEVWLRVVVERQHRDCVNHPQERVERAVGHLPLTRTLASSSTFLFLN